MKASRRKFLWSALGGLGLGGIVAWFNRNDLLRWMILKTDNRDLRLTQAPSIDLGKCALTSSQVEGPFFITSASRRDIREGRPGKPMRLKLQILSMPDCRPIPGATVEIWHCDAGGVYSGYPDDLGHDIAGSIRFGGLRGLRGERLPPVNEARFLRGAQTADANGEIEFLTIFPGWYEPRAPHIHFKVGLGEQELLVSQFYFEPELCDQIYLTEEPYQAWGACPYKPTNDPVIHGDLVAEGLLLRPEIASGSLTASTTIGIVSGA